MDVFFFFGRQLQRRREVVERFRESVPRERVASLRFERRRATRGLTRGAGRVGQRRDGLGEERRARRRFPREERRDRFGSLARAEATEIPHSRGR